MKTLNLLRNSLLVENSALLLTLAETLKTKCLKRNHLCFRLKESGKAVRNMARTSHWRLSHALCLTDFIYYFSSFSIFMTLYKIFTTFSFFKLTHAKYILLFYSLRMCFSIKNLFIFLFQTLIFLVIMQEMHISLYGAGYEISFKS